MITHVIVELDFPIEEKYWDDDMSNNEFYGIGKQLIHCRDCKHRMHDKTCIKVMKRKPDDGYCDEGERNEW